MESENEVPSPGRGGFFFETMILRLHDHLWWCSPYVEDHLL